MDAIYYVQILRIFQRQEVSVAHPSLISDPLCN